MMRLSQYGSELAVESEDEGVQVINKQRCGTGKESTEKRKAVSFEQRQWLAAVHRGFLRA